MSATVEDLVRSALRALEPHLSRPRVILDRLGKEPYLSRYYLTERPHMVNGTEPFNRRGEPKPGIVWPKSPVGIYLHKFHKGDDAGDLHNHPWVWSVSIILAGGYNEERRKGHEVERRRLAPFSVNFIGGDDFHRVDLLEHDAWSLFIVGPKASGWGFWNRHSRGFLPWREYMDQTRRQEDAS